MNTKRYAVAAAALCLLVALLLVPPAQAQSYKGYTCAGLGEHIGAGGYIMETDIRAWYGSNCGQDDDNNDDDHETEQALDDQGSGLPQAPSPPPATCLNLPPRVAVFGYAINTQCQMVDAAGVGNTDVIKRGFIDAVDIWSYVNGRIEVCFRHDGWLVFLDAAYMPRLVMELDAIQRAGMTCGAIEGAGTVVLVNSGAPAAPVPATAPAQPEPAQPAAQPLAEAQPAFDAIPLRDCLIKLVETLFLRAEPAGEIIGLVWLNSEVPAYEIQGYWYKIEFEGRTGYISRHYRKVLRGACG